MKKLTFPECMLDISNNKYTNNILKGVKSYSLRNKLVYLLPLCPKNHCEFLLLIKLGLSKQKSQYIDLNDSNVEIPDSAKLALDTNLASEVSYFFLRDFAIIDKTEISAQFYLMTSNKEVILDMKFTKTIDGLFYQFNTKNDRPSKLGNYQVADTKAPVYSDKIPLIDITPNNDNYMQLFDSESLEYSYTLSSNSKMVGLKENVGIADIIPNVLEVKEYKSPQRTAYCYKLAEDKWFTLEVIDGYVYIGDDRLADVKDLNAPDKFDMFNILIDTDLTQFYTKLTSTLGQMVKHTAVKLSFGKEDVEVTKYGDIEDMSILTSKGYSKIKYLTDDELKRTVILKITKENIR